MKNNYNWVENRIKNIINKFGFNYKKKNYYTLKYNNEIYFIQLSTNFSFKFDIYMNIMFGKKHSNNNAVIIRGFSLNKNINDKIAGFISYINSYDELKLYFRKKKINDLIKSDVLQKKKNI